MMPKENEQKKNSTLDLLKNYCNSLIGLSAVRYNTPLPDLIEHFKIASDLSEEDMAILYNFFDNLTGYCPNSDKQKDSLTFLFKNILIYTSQTASGHKNLIAFLKKQLNENFKTTIKTREFLKDIPSLKTFLESANLISKPIQTLLTALNPKKEEKNISDERIMLINSFGSDLYPWAFNSLMENIKNITEQEDQEFITKISTQDEQPDKTIKILAYLTPAQFKTWFLILFDQKASINNMLAILYKQQLQTLFSYLNGKASENTETLLELITTWTKTPRRTS